MIANIIAYIIGIGFIIYVILYTYFYMKFNSNYKGHVKRNLTVSEIKRKLITKEIEDEETIDYAENLIFISKFHKYIIIAFFVFILLISMKII